MPRPGLVPPAALRRAVAFIQAHVNEPISLSEIAAAAGVGARALQYTFGRYYDTTPTGYLRQVRLERAHRELQAADASAGLTVALVARRWGFSRLGDFSVAYRKVYGRLPGHTLRS
ncbi:helix-turn-helix domain-containing protein [Micromonospora sp. NPDC050397]|uniref:helix-turn-helix domain-containing protein n=1 Tax=Micromonospora sp. NPDC050397 TaxID=3364279 RepID=UPI00384B0184